MRMDKTPLVPSMPITILWIITIMLMHTARTLKAWTVTRCLFFNIRQTSDLPPPEMYRKCIHACMHTCKIVYIYTHTHTYKYQTKYKHLEFCVHFADKLVRLHGITKMPTINITIHDNQQQMLCWISFSGN